MKNGVMVSIIGFLIVFCGIVLGLYHFFDLVNVVEGSVIIIVGVILFWMGLNLKNENSTKR